MTKENQFTLRISPGLLDLVKAHADKHKLGTTSAFRQLIDDALNPPMPIECIDTLVDDLLAKNGLDETLKLMRNAIETIYGGTMSLERPGKTERGVISVEGKSFGFRYSEALRIKIDAYARARKLDRSSAIRELLSLGLNPPQPAGGLKYVVLGWALHGVQSDVAMQRLEGYVRVRDISRQKMQPGWWHELPSYRTSKE